MKYSYLLCISCLDNNTVYGRITVGKIYRKQTTRSAQFGIYNDKPDFFHYPRICFSELPDSVMWKLFL